MLKKGEVRKMGRKLRTDETIDDERTIRRTKNNVNHFEQDCPKCYENMRNMPVVTHNKLVKGHKVMWVKGTDGIFCCNYSGTYTCIDCVGMTIDNYEVKE